MALFDFLKLILFGAVEGITEWLPVSNTGHLAVASRFFAFDDYAESEMFRQTFLATASLGAVIAAALLFLPKNLVLFRDAGGKLRHSRIRAAFWLTILISSLPAIGVNILFADEISAFCYTPGAERSIRMTVVLMLIGGILLWISERQLRNRAPQYKRPDDIPIYLLFGIGLSQIIMIVPGASRFGLILLIALFLGVSRGAAVSTSIFVSIPTILITSLVQILRNMKSLNGFMVTELLAVGITSLFVSFIALRSIVSYLSGRDMRKFAQYRITAAVLLYVFIIL